MGALSREMILLRPSAWLDARRVRVALRGYPVYSPPYRGDSSELSLEHGQANYAYFLRNKDSRLAGLRTFLASFDVRFSVDDVGLRSVDAWLHRYCGHLIGLNRFASYQAFQTFVPSWTGSYSGLNVLWDLGIAAGEFVIKLNPACSWFLNDGPTHGSPPGSIDYLRPCLLIEHAPKYCDAFGAILLMAQAKQEIMRIGRPPGPVMDYVPNALENWVRFRSSS
jgi:hypothetical protein